LGAIAAGSGGLCLDIAEVETLLPAFAPAFTQYHLNRELRFSHRDSAAGWFISPCADGYVIILVGLSTHSEPWDRLMDAMGWPEWAKSEPFATPEARSRNGDAIPGMIQPWLSERTRAELLELFQEAGGASSVLYGVNEAVALPQVEHRAFMQEAGHPDMLGARMPGLPFSQTSQPRSGPSLGDYNEEFRRRYA
jgi:crotonobetainyl-CoA:carnitine CoA-transferase CaiB-like acyl-CoA transferase